MEAMHHEALRKEAVVRHKKETRRKTKEAGKDKKVKKADETEKSFIKQFEENPGAGLLLGSTTVYMDGYHRARCSSAKLSNRYNTMNYMQQY